MFSDEDYEGFAFVHDVTFNMNDKSILELDWKIIKNIIFYEVCLKIMQEHLL